MTATWETGVFMPKSSLSISLLDPSCNVFVQNKTHTSITTPHTKCGTVFTEDGDVITMSNVVKVISLKDRLHGSQITNQKSCRVVPNLFVPKPIYYPHNWLLDLLFVICDAPCNLTPYVQVFSGHYFLSIKDSFLICLAEE